jgi:hypothetical protein
MAQESADQRNFALEEGDDSGSSGSQENDDLDNSFDSVDNHPKAVNYYNHFVGNGQEQWSIQAEETPAIIHEEIDVLNILQEYKKEFVAAARHLHNISRYRILSLSYISPFSNQDILNSFTQNCKQHHSIFRNCVRPLQIKMIPEDVVKWSHRINASYDLNNDYGFKKTVKSIKEELEMTYLKQTIFIYPLCKEF